MIPSVRLRLSEPAGLTRRNEPVVVGVPWPVGTVGEGVDWALEDGDGRAVAVQTRVLARWHDASVKWLSVLFPASAEARGEAVYRLRALPAGHEALAASPLKVTEADGCVTVQTGAGRFTIEQGAAALLSDARDDATAWLDVPGLVMGITSRSGRRRQAVVQQLRVEQHGPVCARIALEGAFGLGFGPRGRLRFAGNLSFYAGSSVVRLELTLQNPGRARHRGGYWDLGDPGSVLLRDWSVELFAAGGTGRRVGWTEGLSLPASSCEGDLEIYQDSSGGIHWQSRNHVNRYGEIPLRFRGYRVGAEKETRSGERASPVVALAYDGRSVACALSEFWQRFPSALEVEGDVLRAGLLPRQFGDLHELQAGEHHTRVIWFDFGSEPKNACERLAWVHEPLVVRCEPAHYAESGAIAYLPGPAMAARPELVAQLGEALEGERSFFAKREAIDEYGWRNFGDIWADHEEAYCDDPRPVISHYNNQYDVLYGFLVQFLLSGDRRWWQLADPLARHIMDIDIYHTDRDKSAYSGGLFWHTDHYRDAKTCTHRTFSRAMGTQEKPAAGGGPGNEHNYASGLLLYHYLTAEPRAREVVVGLADWVIAMDAGEKHLLGLVSTARTGLASSTADVGYHGPGRGAGNSIQALLDGWSVTGSTCYLQKLEEILRRTIHPRDDLRQRRLGDAENRWSYTVYLQALVRYLRSMPAADGEQTTSAYVRESLLHYARWMLQNERFYLDFPDELEYPTETWAAQELRKGTVLLMAAEYAEADERAAFRERGQQILNRAWQSLMSFETRTFTRPLALVLQQGYLETYFHRPAASNGHDSATDAHYDVGEPLAFVPQKHQVAAALRSPRRLLRLVLRAASIAGWSNVWRRSWLAARLESIFLGEC